MIAEKTERDPDKTSDQPMAQETRGGGSPSSLLRRCPAREDAGGGNRSDEMKTKRPMEDEEEPKKTINSDIDIAGTS